MITISLAPGGESLITVSMHENKIAITTNYNSINTYVTAISTLLDGVPFLHVPSPPL